MSDDFRCYLATKDAKGAVSGSVQSQPRSSLPDGDVLIRVRYSSLNYKDALAATGHPGVVKRFPHVPGIDAAGIVLESSSPSVKPGDEVLVTSYELGAGRWGAWSELIRVPAEWVIPRPAGLSLRESMILGTAGLTAAMSVDSLIAHGVRPESGDVVVTGATGGVGCLSVLLLSKLGYRVAAVSGKSDAHHQLKEWGAQSILSREEACDTSDKPLLAAKWAGAIDTVGGRTLATIIRQLQPGGCTAACGLVGGVDLPLSVYPFLLRGVTLTGIDSAYYPREGRLALWKMLAGEWKLDSLESIATTVSLDELGDFVPRILAGQIAGRVIVAIA